MALGPKSSFHDYFTVSRNTRRNEVSGGPLFPAGQKQEWGGEEENKKGHDSCDDGRMWAARAKEGGKMEDRGDPGKKER